MAVSEIRRIELEEEAEKEANKKIRLYFLIVRLFKLGGGMLILIGILLTLIGILTLTIPFVVIPFVVIGIPLIIVGLIALILGAIEENNIKKYRGQKAKEIYRQLLKEELQSSKNKNAKNET